MNRKMLVAALLAAMLPAADAIAQGSPAAAPTAPPPPKNSPAPDATLPSAPQGAPAPAATAPAPEPAAQAAAATAPIGDAIKGRAKTQMCQGCHGIDGWRTAYPEVYTVPKLGNQHQAYLITALQQYKNGQRSHPSMRAIAASLSDQDMADLAAYYAQSGEKTAAK